MLRMAGEKKRKTGTNVRFEGINGELQLLATTSCYLNGSLGRAVGRNFILRRDASDLDRLPYLGYDVGSGL